MSRSSTLHGSRKARLLRRHMASLALEANMNSQIKDALQDFISSNTAAIEKAMENEHDLAKSVPTIPDLVNYLSCPTPQSAPKDSQPMSLEDKAPIHDPNFLPSQQQQQLQQQQVQAFVSNNPNQQHQTRFETSGQSQQHQHPSHSAEGNQFGSSGDSSYSTAEVSNPAHGASTSNSNLQSQHQQQYLQQHHDHYVQNSAFFSSQQNVSSDINKSDNTNTSDNAENVVFSEIQHSNATRFVHNSSSSGAVASNMDTFNAQPSLDDQFQQNVQAQLLNPVDTFQNGSQVSSTSFQNNSVLTPSFTQTPPDTQIQYNNDHNSMNFKGMNLASQNNVNHAQHSQDHFKTAEKMHVDEPVGGFQANPGNHSQHVTHFHQNFQTKSNSMEMGFDSNDFSQGTNNFSIEQYADNTPQVKNYGNNVQTANGNATHSTSFELASGQYQRQSVAGSMESSQFSNQRYPQDATLTHQAQQPGAGEYQRQASSNQTSGGLPMHTDQYVTPDSGQVNGSDFCVQASSNQGQSSFGNNPEMPFQNAGYQEAASPIVNHASSPLTEKFHAQSPKIDSPHTSAYNSQNPAGNSTTEGHQYQSHISHQPSPSDHQQYQASPQSNNTDSATLVLSPNYSSVGFQNNVTSPDNYGVPTPENFGSPFSSQEQQEHQQHQQQQHHQQHQQQQQQHNHFLNGTQQQKSVLGNGDGFMIQAVDESAAQQPDLTSAVRSSSNSQYCPTSVNQGKVVDIAVKSPVIAGFSGSNNDQFTHHTDFSASANAFPQLDLESLASEEFNIKRSVASEPTPQENQNFNYQYSTSTSHANSQSVAQSDQPSFSFGQKDKNNLSGTDSRSFVAAPSGSAEHTSAFQANPPGVNFGPLHHTGQNNQEKYPQPMQIQDSSFAKTHEPTAQITYQATTSRIGETEMDTSAGIGDKRQSLGAGMTYEEIHLSIVEAGKEFSRKTTDLENFSLQRPFSSSGTQCQAGASVTVTSINCSGPQSNLLYQTSTQMSKIEAGTTPQSQSLPLSSSVMTSFGIQEQNNVNSEKVSLSSFNSAPISKLAKDQQLISNLLNGIHASSASGPSQLSNHAAPKVSLCQIGTNNAAPVVTMPNFLENPGVVLPCIQTNNPESLGVLSPANFNKRDQTVLLGANSNQMVVTMIAASPINSTSLVANSGIDSSKVAAISSQQQLLQPVLSLGSVMGVNPQLINSLVRLAHPPITTASTFPQTQSRPEQHSAEVGNFNQMNTPQNTGQVHLIQSPNLALSSNDSRPVVSMPNGLVFQVMSTQSDPKPPALALSIQNNPSKPVNLPLSTPQIGSTILSAGTTAVVGGQQSMTQPHIVITLEDLKKLLTQKTSPSPTSESQPKEKLEPGLSSNLPSSISHGSAPSMILQSSTGSPISFIQPIAHQSPRLTLPNPPRLMHPHEQLQQTREKLQQIVQQAHQSQTFPTNLPAHKNQEHTILFAREESNGQNSQNQKKVQTSIFAIQQDQQASHKMQIIQEMQVMEQKQQIQQGQHIQLPLKQTQETLQTILLNKREQLPSDSKLPPLQLPGSQTGQKLIIQHNQLMQVHDQKESLLPSHKILNPGQIQQELQALKSIMTPMENSVDQEKQQPQQLPTEKAERSDRSCSDNLRKDYKHLHSLLTGDSSLSGSANKSAHSKVLLGQLNSQSSSQSHSPQIVSGTSIQSKSSPAVTTAIMSSSAFNFVPLSSAPPLSLGSSCSTFLPAAKEGFSFRATAGSFPPPTSGFALSSNSSSAPLTTLAFTKASFTSAFSKVSEVIEPREKVVSSAGAFASLSTPPCSISSSKSEEPEMTTNLETDTSSRQASILAQILTENNKRSHSPLSVDLSSPANSNSEAPSPLSSPNPFEDSNTQLTLVERSAKLHIKSDTMQGIDDDDGDNETFSDTFHKRPSTGEPSTSGENDPKVPIKIAKASINTDARSSVQAPSSPEPAFDIGSVVSSASNFSFAFGNHEENASEVFTFGSSIASTSTTDSLVSISSRSPKTTGNKPVPTQPVRPTARKQKEYGLKAYYPSKCEGMELTILEQPEPQHRARYQTEGSRGAIKDASQQGYPVIKLNGYNKQTKLQVYIGDESARVKPHGFYQACRVFGKNSTPCSEQEIEGTTVIDIDLVPENEMIAKLDCIGILKLRNADVERRIGPKRARDKKKNNTRARLVMRCVVERQNSHGELMLQVVSSPIVCTQPVGQPEICRMSLTECSVEGGESLFIIGKNFKNKGTTVTFQKLDPNNESVVKWQAAAEIEQEFFQPTHMICKIPPFEDITLQKPQPVVIVVSCAGRKSDPHKFTYKPVYPVSSEVKQELPMELDSAVSASRSLPFVSPEALQLNHLVHQSHALSSGSNTIFQLPPGAVPTIETHTSNVLKAKPSLTPAASGLIKPARLLISSGASEIPSSSAMVSNSMFIPQASSSSFKTGVVDAVTAAQAEARLPTFLLDEKPDGLITEGLSPPASLSTAAGQKPQVSFHCIVHSTSKTQPSPSPSHTVSSGHVGTVLTSSAQASPADATVSASSAEAAQAQTSKPIFVVLDPAALQNSTGGEQIQQLLQQLVNAQNR
ncbi:nuclear factor of activated t-cells 5 [Plakobranchus ocellatus]|uniref:Nuclear factor of activated t-cells 5 n=1 Tax=Plakobranchus ocellatus TaxID=259542 RepID=A0AAV3ZA34_9GAST|nr:nuclear factor of activated t-cells 5 [Plakobranchus ocellatus]